ncbi:baculoviral IAP repeat-containing protein 5.1 [Microcaecilia unicolor]|uniref:Baculoviral IAP repeat-containing protein 5.1-like n=1 Tax=Microcaecilia unicolor TaxID=1415580 RepID=A0A6P7X6V9_9AMPH|nr:baculoviral IAP repeat-containing protein 5.1-like [Microcaecilia unicolor]
MASSLSDLSLASKHLLEFERMYDYENRLKTFTDWPFTEGCQCTPENMSRAGFIHCPSENEPDVVQCFFCLKELEGWEPDDDPWMEHCTRSADCAFITLHKNFDDLTMEEFIRLELERTKCFYRKNINGIILLFEKALAITTKNLLEYCATCHQCTIELDP